MSTATPGAKDQTGHSPGARLFEVSLLLGKMVPFQTRGWKGKGLESTFAGRRALQECECSQEPPEGWLHGASGEPGPLAQRPLCSFTSVPAVKVGTGTHCGSL